MSRFDSAIALALRLITKNGLEVTLRTFTEAAPADPQKPWETGAATSSDQLVQSVWFEFETSTGGFGLVSDTTIESGDKRVYIPSSGLTHIPTPSSQLIRQGTTWRVIDVKELTPNAQSIMFELKVRQ